MRAIADFREFFASNAHLFDYLKSISGSECRCSCYSFDVRHARNCINETAIYFEAIHSLMQMELKLE